MASDFLGAIFAGANPTLGGDINSAGSEMNFGTSVGQGDTRKASDFYGDILGGDPTKIAKFLAPQIKTMQEQGQQRLATTSQFGDRSGGTNAENQRNTDTTRSNIDDLISNLTGGAAGKLAEIGTTEQGLGLSANQLQEQEAQQQLQNFQNSILGGTITSGVNGALSEIPGGIF